MRYCTYCHLEVPDQAKFCGSCGRIVQSVIRETKDNAGVPNRVVSHEDTPTFISGASYPTVTAEDAPTFISGASYPEVAADNTPDFISGASYPGVTAENMPTFISGASHPKITADNTPTFISGASYPTLAPERVGPGNPQTPIPQGVDEEDEKIDDPLFMLGMFAGEALKPSPTVPAVGGTPQMGNVPVVHGAPTLPSNGLPGAGQGVNHLVSPETHLPTLSAQPMHQASANYGVPSQPQGTSSAYQTYQPTAYSQQHTSQFTRPHALHKLSGGTKWALAGTATLVVLAGVVSVILLFFPPGLALSGSRSISVGGMLHIHGQGFWSGKSVALNLDNGTKLPGNGYVVTSAGTFDAAVPIGAGVSLGTHTIHATEGFPGRSATWTFTVVPKPALLVVNASSLNFGDLEVGKSVILSLGVGNSGGQSLRWQADSGGTSWLKVLAGAGLIGANGLQQFTNLRADTTHLQLGNYTSTLTINSNGGTAHVQILLHVVHKMPPQGKLYVSQTSIDLGQLQVGAQTTAGIAVANEGTLPLNWQVSAGSANWLSFDASSGHIQPGAAPYTVQLTANTASLAAGNYSAPIQISSNGGSATVMVTLVVLPPPINPTPIVVPTPVLGASPNSFTTPQDPNCSYDPANGWTCKATLSNAMNAQTNLNWSASASGVNNVVFTPTNGTLLPGKTATVQIFIPNTICPTTAVFTFAGPGNSPAILWNCTAPQLVTNPQSFTNGCQICTVTISLPKGSEGELSWLASSASSISGITPSSPSGTLSPTQPTEVTFSVPQTDCTSGADFNFTGPNNGVDVHVPWSCTSLPIHSSTSSITANSDCTYNAGWTCNIQLSTDSNGQGSATWAASSSGITGISFNPPNSTLTPGQTAPVTITVPDTSCPASATLTFTAPANTITIPWQCNLPTLKVSPSSFSVPDSNCSYSGGSDGNGWSCTEMLSLSGPGDPNLSWNTSGSVGGAGIQYSPSSGTLTAGNPTQVTITIPNTSCPASTTLSFLVSGQSSVDVTWTCPVPNWSLSTNSFSPSNCPQDSSGNWSCTETIAEGSSSQGNLSWSVSSDLSGVSYYTVSSGVINSGTSQPITITIPASDCTNGSFTFSDQQGTDTQTASWTCSSPTVTPSSTDTPTPTSTSSPTATPTDTATPTPTDTPTPTPTATDTPTPTPTDTPTPTPTDTPTPASTSTSTS